MLTLETAKKLKEVGFNKGTEKSYAQKILPSSDGYGKNEGYHLCETKMIGRFAFSSVEPYPCPSLEELLAEMPYRIYYNDTEAYFILVKIADKRYEAEYKEVNGTVDYNSRLVVDPTEAVAQLYIKLRQEGLIK